MWGQSDGFGGGGFVSSQGGGGGNQFGSPSAGGAEKKTRRSNNIVPVTVKQLLDCQDEYFHILDTEAQVVTILGLVTQVEQTTTKVSVHIDDQTGVIECLNYVGTEGGADVPFVPMEGTYGRVVGALRTMKQNKYLVIFKFLPVTDMNELTAHLLEVIQVPMKLKKLKELEAQKTGVGMSGGLNNTLSNSMMVNNFGGAGPMGMMGGSGMGGGGAAKPGFNSNQNMVLSIIQSNRSDAGMHKDEIMRNMKGKVTMKELDKILEDLSGEGHIYSTVDDDHFKTTD